MALGALMRREARAVEPGNVGPLSWPDYLRLWEQFGFNGVQYMVPAGGQAAMTAMQASRNPIVMRCMALRATAFAQARMAFRDLKSKRIFGAPALGIFEEPWPQGFTYQMMGRAEMDNSRFGNSYWWFNVGARGPQWTWLDPTKVDIITGNVEGPDADEGNVGKYLLAYHYRDKAGQPGQTLFPEEVLHYWTMPDPTHPFRGLSWLSSLLPDVVADQDLTDFKHAFVNNAATPALAIKVAPGTNIDPDNLRKIREKVEARHTGPANAFKTLFLSPGLDLQTIGVDLKNMELQLTQSVGEVRLCVAAGVHPSLAAIAQGLQGSALNAGNYLAIRRSFVDYTIRPLWQAWCGAASRTPAAVTPPQGSEIWYDDSEVFFLKDDAADAANVKQKDATTILTLVNSGYDPATVPQAVKTGNWDLLQHLGVLSVQLQPMSALGGGQSGNDDDTDSGGGPDDAS